MKENKKLNFDYISSINALEIEDEDFSFEDSPTIEDVFFECAVPNALKHSPKGDLELNNQSASVVKTGEDWYFENVLTLRKTLDTDTQKNLLYKYKNSNNKEEKNWAFNELVLTNQRLVVFIAKAFSGAGVPMEDLIQEGNIGLMKAIQKYDFSFDCALSTYATWWIKQAMLRSVQDMRSSIRVPVYIYEKIYKLRQILATAHREKKRIPSEKDLSKQLNCSPEQLREVIRCSSLIDLVSLSTPVAIKKGSDIEDMGELQDFVFSSEFIPENEYRKNEIAETILLEMKKTLSERSFDIMCRRYGIGEYNVPQTLETIGQVYGVTKERIRQVQYRAEKKLRANASLQILIE